MNSLGKHNYEIIVRDFKMSMTVLVTGGLGFIGHSTAVLLHKNGFNVTVLDNLDPQVHGQNPDPTKFSFGIDRVTIGSITNERQFTRALADVEYIYHFAALTGSNQSFIKAGKYSEVNAVGSSLLFQILLKNNEIRRNIRKIIVASSSYVYGEGAYFCKEHGLVYPSSRAYSDLLKGKWEIRCPFCNGRLDPYPVAESKPVQNPNPYSLSKYYTESLSLLYSEILSIPVVIFRYFNVYGPGQSLRNPYTGVISIFYSRLRAKKNPVIYEDGHMKRDFVYIDDIAKINEMAMNKGEGIYNVGTGVPTDIITIYHNLSRNVNSHVSPTYNNESRPGDIRSIYANKNKLISEFGNINFTSVDEGINKFTKWANREETEEKYDAVEEERKKIFFPP